jgi:hypothetical protein
VVRVRESTAFGVAVAGLISQAGRSKVTPTGGVTVQLNATEPV